METVKVMNFSDYLYIDEQSKLRWKRCDLIEFKTARSCKTWNTRFARTLALFSMDSKGYRYGSILGKNYRYHRVFYSMYHSVNLLSEDIVDHINGDKLDNNIENLRLTTYSGNSRNQKLGLRNTSGHFGVSLDKKRNKWRSRIHHNNKDIYLGYYETFNEAVEARKNAEIKYGYMPEHGKR